MYKLLLVSDSEEVLSAFDQIRNWELQGFKKPHIRHDYDGMLDSLGKHHADGIAIAVASSDEEERMLQYLQKEYPYTSIFQAGKDPEQVLEYLNELKTLLNRIYADFANERLPGLPERLQSCRHEFFRNLINGKVKTSEEVYRNMRLLRSRMDADRPSLLTELSMPVMEDDRLEGRWHGTQERLEMALRNSFGGDYQGMHILPTIHPDGRILVLACPLHGVEQSLTPDEMTAMLTAYYAKCITHLEHFQGISLHIAGIRVLPALTVLCRDEEKKEAET